MSMRMRWATATLMLAPLLALSGCSCFEGSAVAVVVQDGRDLVGLDSSGVAVTRSTYGPGMWSDLEPGDDVHPLAELDARGELVVELAACVQELCWEVVDGRLWEVHGDDRSMVLAPLADPWAMNCGGPAAVSSIMVTTTGDVVASVGIQGVAVRSDDGQWQRNDADLGGLHEGFGKSWQGPVLTMSLPILTLFVVGSVSIALRWRALRSQNITRKTAVTILAIWGAGSVVVTVTLALVAVLSTSIGEGGRLPAAMSVAGAALFIPNVVAQVLRLSRGGEATDPSE